MNTASRKPRVLVLASDCNPEWPSLPVVGYKYARALSQVCEVTVVTQIRNKENIQKLGADGMKVDYIDTEYIAGPMYKLGTFLRGGDQVAWSTSMIMAYPSYVEFERQVWKRYRTQIKAGDFDIIHRITPMSPTMPSYIAGRGAVPFILGPLNGNLPWPKAFATEQKREKERLRKLRDLYKFLPFARRTYRKAALILAAFRHTIDDLSPAAQKKTVMFPEVGYDPALFYPPKDMARPADKPLHFMFAGRLVPYKLPEVAVRAFCSSEAMKAHKLHILGDGPEQPRLEAIVAEYGAEDRVIFEGRHPQAVVAERMRDCDVFVFPSIRELGAGVVVEAMAAGMAAIVVDYGGPAYLIAADRGIKVPLAPLDGLVDSFRTQMEHCADLHSTGRLAPLREAAVAHARDKYDWARKADLTVEIYRGVMDGKTDFPAYYA